MACRLVMLFGAGIAMVAVRARVGFKLVSLLLVTSIGADVVPMALVEMHRKDKISN